MSLDILKDVLLEELDRRERSKALFIKKLNNDFVYTKIKEKIVKGNVYLYVYSCKEKKDIYLGVSDSVKKKEYEYLISKRKEVMEQLESVESDIPKLRKMVDMI